MVLESYSYEVALAESGEAAMRYLVAVWPDTPRAPDVMLLDLTLEGMTGEELYGQIRARFGSVPPTLVLSAVQHGEERIRHLPGVRFLAKPYTLDQLNEQVQLMLAKKAA